MTASSSEYELVRLPSGLHTIRSLANGERMHPDPGPAAEADALYVSQTKLSERIRLQQRSGDEFVIWDVGLGAGGNALSVIKAARETGGRLRMLSFDQTLEPLRFALREHKRLEYFAGYDGIVEELLSTHRVAFSAQAHEISWEAHEVDFPAWIGRVKRSSIEPPQAIFFDAWSPRTNPAMWTATLFANLYRVLDDRRPCVLVTYSRSTIIRVSLLLAGFWVGRGKGSGRKEETTIAANAAEHIDEPLDGRWLERARRSDSAEPLRGPVYRREALTDATWEKLRRHPQFSGA